MPPGPLSRHLLSVGVSRVTDGLTFLLDPEPFRFVNRSDNRRVVVEAGDTWQGLAQEHLRPINNANELWWVICFFQPEPVLDPTVPPTPGTVVYIPSPEFVTSDWFADSRRDDYEI